MAALVSEYTLEFFTLLNARGKKELIEWCMKGLIASSYECPKCNEQMGLNERKSVVWDGFEWRCRKKATRGLLATDHVILNHGQVTWTTPELASPLLTTTPHQREDVSALDRFNVHRCPTRRVFSGTGLEPVTKQAAVRYLYHSATAATRFRLNRMTLILDRFNEKQPLCTADSLWYQTRTNGWTENNADYEFAPMTTQLAQNIKHHRLYSCSKI
ncbi:uncharacterized protein TNCV_2061171 [Trichonephila clavipes]|nr:uncharacterized protein TNCV_2061171 [Trichonephila clavipes]